MLSAWVRLGRYALETGAEGASLPRVVRSLPSPRRFTATRCEYERWASGASRSVPPAPCPRQTSSTRAPQALKLKSPPTSLTAHLSHHQPETKSRPTPADAHPTTSPVKAKASVHAKKAKTPPPSKRTDQGGGGDKERPKKKKKASNRRKKNPPSP